MAEASPSCQEYRKTERAEPAHLCGGSRRSERERQGSDHAFPHVLPLPPAPWFYICRKDQGRSVKIAESADVCGASERLSQRWGQRTKPCAEAELSSWRDTAGWGQAGHSHSRHRQEALGSRDSREPCLGKMKNQKHFASRELERGSRLSLLGLSIQDSQLVLAKLA